MATVIEGDRALPSAYPHPHASDDARQIAQSGLILRVQVGSGVHGTAVVGQDDRDEMGICLEPPAYVTGVARVPGVGHRIAFEQYERHTVWDEPGGLANRSGAGDLDVVVYSARKWARLALAGNPTVLLVLYVPDAEVVMRTAIGAELVDNAHRFVSRSAAQRFLGYLRAQRDAMTGETAKRTNRPELVEAHGFDTKFAMHALRLGHQGVELLTTGRITLPVAGSVGDRLRAVRRGEVPLLRCSTRSPRPRRNCCASRDPPTCRRSPTKPGSTNGSTGRTRRTGHRSRETRVDQLRSEDGEHGCRRPHGRGAPSLLPIRVVGPTGNRRAAYGRR